MPTPPARLTLEGLRALMALAEHGSVRAAATALGTSRSTLRRWIEQLEDSVGATLHARGPEGVLLTEPGRVLIDQGQPVLDAADAADAAARGATEPPIRALTLLAPDGMPPPLIGAMIGQARATAPDLELTIAFSANPLAELDHGAHLVAHFGPPPSTGAYITRRLRTVPERLVATTDYLDAHGRPQRVDDLAAHTLLTWCPPGEDPAQWPLRGGGTTTTRPVLRSPDIHLVRWTMLQGLGIARVLDAGVPDPPGSAAVEVVLGDTVGTERPLRLLVPEGLHRTPQLRHVLALVDLLAPPSPEDLPGG